MGHPYCTERDLTALRIMTEADLIQLTDTAGLGTADPVAITGAALAASAEIDQYLAPLAAVPLAVVPPAVVRLAAILTRFYLYGNAPTEHVQRAYDAAVKTLTLMSQGKLAFGASPSATPAPPADGGGSWDGGAHVWGRGPEGGLA